jgi:hypothetical protein
MKRMVREMKGEAEAAAIRNALEQTQWRRKEAAELLGICYKALIYKSRQYGILDTRRNIPPSSSGTDEMRAINLASGAPAKIGASGFSSLKAVAMKGGAAK